MLYLSSTVCRAAAPRHLASSGSPSTASSADANADASPGGTSRPFFRSVMITSVEPGKREAIDGTPDAIASSNAIGRPSRAEGST
jgi:hypothetical protein